MPQTIKSWFDKYVLTFDCPKCGLAGKQVTIGYLRDKDHFPCPNCNHSFDLTAEPYRSELAEKIRLATELDKRNRV